MDKITILDIDDTLMFSESKIRYILPVNGVYDLKNEKSLSTEEFATQRHTLDGADFNFMDFRCEWDMNSYYKNILFNSNFSTEELNRRCLVQYRHNLIHAPANDIMMKEMKQIVDSSEKIGVITARGGTQKDTYEALKEFFKMNGVDVRNKLDKRMIFCISNDKFVKHNMMNDNLAGCTEDMKSLVVERYIKGFYGFKDISFYDDDFKNCSKLYHDNGVNAFLVNKYRIEEL